VVHATQEEEEDNNITHAKHTQKKWIDDSTWVVFNEAQEACLLRLIIT